MKHWEEKLATYVYNHCNICNIPNYFCNIHMKYLQHTSETSKTLGIYAYNVTLVSGDHHVRRVDELDNRLDGQSEEYHRLGHRELLLLGTE